jgi:8-oxo-dGTP pyrophosphatase MutT (NUDIX family)
MTPLELLLAHPTMVRLARALDGQPGRIVRPDVPVRHAATAATLRLGTAGPELLLIRRALQEHDPWSGHVAWPGGRQEREDADLAATAVRETREETGLDLSRDGRILGTLDDIHPRSPQLPPIVVRPFVAALGGRAPVVQNEELAGHVWVPVDALLDEQNWGSAPILIRGLGTEERPVFSYADFQVWGMTEYMLRQLVGLLRGPG